MTAPTRRAVLSRLRATVLVVTCPRWGLLAMAGIAPSAQVLAEPGPAARQHIDELLKAIESHGELKFIRQGKAYDAKEAASHLRQKLLFAGDRINTAEQFIEHVASHSSQSGEPYRIRFPDGREEDAGKWLRDELRRIDARR